MQTLSIQNGIHLLTNYETSWYPSVHAAKDIVDAGELGPLRKVVVHDGHPGPVRIGVNEEFLEWLIDPTLSGGGALTDFGSYGANLLTWLIGNERPQSVTAVTQQMQPDLYPEVEDEATIIVSYPKMQGIIQASWNWPVSRKDMEVYGQTGQLLADNATEMRIRLGDAAPVITKKALPLDGAYEDPFAYLEAVVRGRIEPAQDLSSLSNNMIVMEILDAAKRSAQTGQSILF